MHLGDGVGVGEGLGKGVGVGDGTGVGAGVGVGLGDGEGLGVGVGDGNGVLLLPPIAAFKASMSTPTPLIRERKLLSIAKDNVSGNRLPAG